ncbi:hypothetical protein [Pseudoxanthomonas putridarboris]|uniref:Uncharacterized protein n=1 Tax=Pseudoxanthomonas putridarboris TaxID=752605 RepID=A0ABU9J465_9GAMM
MPVPQQISAHFKQQQAKILDALHEDVMAGIPDTWTSAVLTIETDGNWTQYKLKNNVGEPGKATISDLIAQLSEEFYVSSASCGSAWIKADLSYTKVSDNNWSFRADFTYAD